MEEIISTIKGKDQVHKILAHSYSLYLGALLVGLFLDFQFPVTIFSNPTMASLGAVFLFFATCLIVWAQSTNRDLEIDTEMLSIRTFMDGPYKYSRTPTHWGLFLLVLGFGIIYNALFIVVLTTISFIITKLIFIKQEEELLAQKYGAPYREYQKHVRL